MKVKRSGAGSRVLPDMEETVDFRGPKRVSAPIRQVTGTGFCFLARRPHLLGLAYAQTKSASVPHDRVNDSSRT